jgi:ribose transport system permease protein
MTVVELKPINRFLKLPVALWHNYRIIFVFFIIIALCGIAAPNFLRVQNLLNVLRSTSTVGLISLGMTFVIISGGIDLSSGPVLATSGAAFILLQRMTAADGSALVPLPLAIIACCLVAVAFGFVNGIIITKASLPPFIVTLGVGIIARSLVMYLCQGATILGRRVPEFTRIGGGSIFGTVPIPFVVAVITAIVLTVLLKKTRYGTYVFAIGGNEITAKLSGIKVDKIKILTYMLSGLCTGMAAVIEMSRMAAVAPVTAGYLYEFEAITAVLIGGTVISGGKGRVIGTVVGFIILGVINNMMIMLSISPFLSGAVKGVVILFAILSHRRER